MKKYFKIAPFFISEIVIKSLALAIGAWIIASVLLGGFLLMKAQVVSFLV